VYTRSLDPFVLAFSLSLYRHPFIYILFSSLFTKVYYQAFFWVLIDLIVEILGLIIKSCDNQTESWNPVSNDLIIKSFDTIIW
jgi:hypothetical protein